MKTRRGKETESGSESSLKPEASSRGLEEDDNSLSRQVETLTEISLTKEHNERFDEESNSREGP